MTRDPKVHVYIPNSFQVPKGFVDDGLIGLLGGNDVKLLFVACRAILASDDGRATRRSRLSVTRFMGLSKLSRQSVLGSIRRLETANILLPIDRPNSDGQLYELNLGERGGYDWAYLESLRDGRVKNTNPEKARAVRAANRLSRETNVTDPPAISGGNAGLANRPPESGDRSIYQSKSGLFANAESLWQIDSLKLKVKNENNNTPISDESDPNAELWARALEVLEKETTNNIFRNYLKASRLVEINAGTYVVAVADRWTRDWLTLQFAGQLRRLLVRLTGQAAEVRFVVVSPPQPSEDKREDGAGSPRPTEAEALQTTAV